MTVRHRSPEAETAAAEPGPAQLALAVPFEAVPGCFLVLPLSELEPETRQRLVRHGQACVRDLAARLQRSMPEAAAAPMGVAGEGSPEVAAARPLTRRFLDEMVEEAPGRRVSAGELYAAYAEWCTRCGERPVNRNLFGRTATTWLPRRKGGCNWYLDVQLREG